MRPSFETLRRIVRACGLEVTYGLAVFDDSYDAFIHELLRMTPAERLADARERERRLSEIRGAALRG